MTIMACTRRVAAFIAIFGAALEVSGCLELRTAIELQVDGSGRKSQEIVVVKQQLDQLGPEAAKEVEDKLRPKVHEFVATEAPTPPGGKPAEFSEYVDDKGNRVFTVKSEFGSLADALAGEWDCSWEETTPGSAQSHLLLRCQSSRKLAAKLSQGVMSIPYSLRMRLPGRVVSTNGNRLSDDEVEWAFKAAPRPNSLITVEFEKGGFPVRTFGIVIAALLAVAALAGAGYWLVRRRGAGNAADASRTTASDGPGSRLALCPNCNAPISPGLRFCRSCGTDLEAVAANQTLCSICGSPNAAGTRFCRSCGARLTAAVPPADTSAKCPQCASAVPADAKFCKSCGASLMAAAVTAAPPAPSVVAAPIETPDIIPDAPDNDRTLPGEQEIPVTAPSPSSEPEPSSKMPAMAIIAGIVVIIAAGWFGYAKFASQEEAPVEPQPPAGEPVVPAAEPAAFVPPEPMGRDPANGCHVWKPDYLPTDTVRWAGACNGFLAEGYGRAEWNRESQPTMAFEGTFHAGYLEGAGRMTSVIGESYEGGYARGRREGQGMQVLANGDRYEGGFKADRREGRGVLTHRDGVRVEGEFRSDQLVSQDAPPPVAAPTPVPAPTPPVARKVDRAPSAPATSRGTQGNDAAPAAAPTAPVPDSRPSAAVTIDDQYRELKKRECAHGIAGLLCRERLKLRLCDDHWSDNPPAGQTLCKRQEIPKEFGSR